MLQGEASLCCRDAWCLSPKVAPWRRKGAVDGDGAAAHGWGSSAQGRGAPGDGATARERSSERSTSECCTRAWGRSTRLGSSRGGAARSDSSTFLVPSHLCHLAMPSHYYCYCCC